MLLLYDTAVGGIDETSADSLDEESLAGSIRGRRCTVAHVDALDRAALSLAGFLLQYLNTSSRAVSALSLHHPAVSQQQQAHASTHSLESAASGGSAGSGTRARTSPVVGYSQTNSSQHQQMSNKSASLATPRVAPRSSSALGTPSMTSTPGFGGKGFPVRPWHGLSSNSGGGAMVSSTIGVNNNSPSESLFEYDSPDDLRILSVSASGNSGNGSRRGSIGGGGGSSLYSSTRSNNNDRDSRRFGGGAATSLGHYSGM